MSDSLKWRVMNRLPWRFWGPIYRLRDAFASPAERFRRSQAGQGTYVDPTVQVFGYENVHIGQNACISEWTLLNASRRGEFNDSITIGSFSHIGRRNFFSTGGSIEVGHYGMTGMDCHFLGCGHDTSSPLRPYISTGLTPGAPIVLEDNCWLTTSVTVHQGVRIGRGSVIGARCVIRKDVPPFSIVAGHLAGLRRRFDFKNNVWTDIANWVDNLEDYMPTAEQYKALLDESRGDLRPPLHASSTRFGWLR